MLNQIQETRQWLEERTELRPHIAIILGTGLGNLAQNINVTDAFDYADIPNFAVSTVEGHKGQLLFGHLDGRPVAALSGRFHYYEGYTMQQVTFPIRVLHALGATTLFVSNASGGMNPAFSVGDVMLITDHINLMPEHPLRGRNIPPGPRFPDMSKAYDPELQALARTIASERGFRLQEGVYLATQGPTFETPAEYRMFRFCGADAVGMSTVPEVIVANHCGLRVLGLSVITDLGLVGQVVEVSHEEVQQAAVKAAPVISGLIDEMVKRLEPAAGPE